MNLDDNDIRRIAAAVADELVRRGVLSPSHDAPPSCSREDQRVIVGYQAAAEYTDEPMEALRSATRRKRLPSGKVGGKVAFRIADLDERKLAHALIAESARPFSAVSSRFRPMHKAEKIGDTRSGMDPERAEHGQII
jgi:hypothetical protein